MPRVRRIFQWLAVSPMLLLALIVATLNWVFHNLNIPRYAFWQNIWKR